MLPARSIDCPYCGETIEVVIDDSVDQQKYVEDCSVCCRPINVEASVDHSGDIRVRCWTDTDTC
ncbi:MAG: CPXCG motif-containing cysteine-rich protein [Gammaproteobacteria bacterium]